MKIVNRGSRLVSLFLGAGILVFLVCSGEVSAQTTYRYKQEECVRCHAGRVNDIAAAGGGHKGVLCLGCHAGHPPDVAKPIAPCSKCHSRIRNTHFEISGCLNCHTNPHTPLNISFKGVGKEACRMCHGLQSWQFKKYESKHSTLDCSACHDVHRKFPQCTQCHIPHSGKIVGDCSQCHKAHMPRLVAFPESMPSMDCGSCHKTAADLLNATTSKHKSLTCKGCHQQKHRMIPACEDCHGTPHPQNIIAKFPNCGWCHNVAHDLNWSATETFEAKEGTAKKQQI